MAEEGTQTANITIADAVHGIFAREYADQSVRMRDIVRLLNAQQNRESKISVLRYVFDLALLPYDASLAKNEEVYIWPKDEEARLFQEKIDKLTLPESIWLSGRQVDDTERDAVLGTVIDIHEMLGNAGGEMMQVMGMIGIDHITPVYGTAPAYAPLNMKGMRATIVANPDPYVAVQTLLSVRGIEVEQVIEYIVDQQFDRELAKALLSLALQHAVRAEKQRYGPGVLLGGLFGEMAMNDPFLSKLFSTMGKRE